MAQASELLTGSNSVILESSENGNYEFGPGADTVVSRTLDGSEVKLGAGNNKITIVADFGGSGGLAGNASVTADRGNDSLIIRGAYPPYVDSGIADGEVDLGAGNNTVSITHIGDAIASDGSLTTGDGTDSFVLNGGVRGDVNMGAGKNTLVMRGDLGGSISGEGGADSVTIKGGLDGAVNLGEGANLLLASGGADGASYGGGAGVDNVTVKGDVDGLDVDLGAGRNVLKISEGRYDGTVGADFDLDNLDVTASAGDDSITMDGHNKADGSAAKLVLGAGDGIELGAGRDTLSLANLSLSGEDTSNSNEVNLGEGDDAMLVGGGAAGNATKALLLNAGAGKDALTIGEMGGYVTVNLGDGDDRLTLGGAAETGNVVEGGAGLDSLALSGGAVRLADLDLDGDGVEILDLTSRSITTLELSSADLDKFSGMELTGLSVTNRGPNGVKETMSSAQTPAADKKFNLAALNEALQRRIDTDAGTTDLLRINGERGDVVRLANNWDENGNAADEWQRVGTWSGYDVWATSSKFITPTTTATENDAIKFALIKTGLTVEVTRAPYANLLAQADYTALADGRELVLAGLTADNAGANFGFKTGTYSGDAEYKVADVDIAGWKITDAGDSEIATLNFIADAQDPNDGKLVLSIVDAEKFKDLGSLSLQYVQDSTDPDSPVSYLEFKAQEPGAKNLIDLATGNAAGETFYSQDGALAAGTAAAFAALKGGAGADHVTAGAIGAGDKGLTTLDLGQGANELAAGGDMINARIVAGSGNDTVAAENLTGLVNARTGAYSKGVTFELGAGDNEISAWSAQAATVKGGAGADVVRLVRGAHEGVNPDYQGELDAAEAVAVAVDVENGAGLAEISAAVNQALNAKFDAENPASAGMFFYVEAAESATHTGDIDDAKQWVYGQIDNPEIGNALDSDGEDGVQAFSSFAAAEADSTFPSAGDEAGVWFKAPNDSAYLGKVGVDSYTAPVSASAGEYYIDAAGKSYTWDAALNSGSGDFAVDGTAKSVPPVAEWHWNAALNDNAGGWEARATDFETPVKISGWSEVAGGSEAEVIVTLPAERRDAGVLKQDSSGAVAGSGVSFTLGEGDNELYAGEITGGSITAGAGNDFIDARALQHIANVNLGAGHNRIELTLESGEEFRDGNAVLKTSVTLGAGDDVFLSEGRLNALKLNMGEGDNRLEVTDSVESSTLLSTLALGAGDDYVSLSAAAAAGTAEDPQRAAALEGASLNVGNGDNFVSLTGDLYGISRETGKAKGAAASLTSGTGDDVISVTAGGKIGNAAIHDAGLTDKGGVNTITVDGANAMLNATVNLGAGDDWIRIITGMGTDGTAAAQTTDDTALNYGGQLFAGWKGSAAASGVTDYAGLEGVAIAGGSFKDAGGDNELDIDADNIGIMGAVSIARGKSEAGVRNTVVSLNGSGANRVSIIARYYGLYGGTLNLGSGADTVSIRAESTTEGVGNDSDAGEYAALSFNSVLSLGAGDNTVRLSAHGNQAYGLRNSSLIAGAGADTISVTAAASGADAAAYAMFAEKTAGAAANAKPVPAKIDAGAGNDVISVSGALNNASILAGAGDDRLELDVNASTDPGVVGNVSATGANSIDGGAGLDVLAFDASARLSLKGASDAEARTNAVKGFEVVELSGADTTFTIDDLASLKALTASLTALPAGELKGKILRVNGADIADKADASTLAFDTGNQKWTRVEGGYRIDGRDYNLFQTTETGTRKTVTQLLVENTVKVTGLIDADDTPAADLVAVDPLFSRSLTGFVPDGTKAGEIFQTLAAPIFSNTIAGDPVMEKGEKIFGAGADKISFTLKHDQDGAVDSYINLGAGNNSLTVNGGGGDDVAFKGDFGKTVVVAGAGNDAVSISNVGKGLLGSNMNLGEGANRVDISAATSALDGATLHTGSGVDSISISGGLDNASVIDSGAGNDTLLVDELNDSSKIVTGAGNDRLTLGLVAGTDTTGRAVVELGAGNDSLFLTGAASNGSFNGGAGLDTLNIAGADSALDLSAVLEDNQLSGLEILDLTNKAANVLDARKADLAVFGNMDADGLTFSRGLPNAAASIPGVTAAAARTAATAALNAELDKLVVRDGDNVVTGFNLLRITAEKGDAVRLLNENLAADAATHADWRQVGSYSGYQVWASKAYDAGESEFTAGTQFALVKGATLVTAAKDVDYHLAVDNRWLTAGATNSFGVTGNAAGTELGEDVAFNTGVMPDGYKLEYDTDHWNLIKEGATAQDNLTLGAISFNSDDELTFKADVDLDTPAKLEELGKLGSLTLQYTDNVNNPGGDLSGEIWTGALTLDFGRDGSRALDFSGDHVRGVVSYDHANNFANKLARDAKITGSWGADEITVGWTDDASVTGLAGDVSIGSAAAGYALTTVSLGEGDNELDAGGSVVNTDILAGAGDDSVAVDGNVTGLLSANKASMSKAVDINLGAGDNELTAGSMAGGSYTGLGGDDDVRLEFVANGVNSDYIASEAEDGVFTALNDLTSFITSEGITPQAGMFADVGTGENVVEYVYGQIDNPAHTGYQDTLDTAADLPAVEGGADDWYIAPDAAYKGDFADLAEGESDLGTSGFSAGDWFGTTEGDGYIATWDDDNNEWVTSTDNTTTVSKKGNMEWFRYEWDDTEFAASGSALDTGATAPDAPAATMPGWDNSGNPAGTTAHDIPGFSGDAGRLTEDGKKLVSGSAVAFKMGDGDNSLTAANIYGGTYTGGAGDDDLDVYGSGTIGTPAGYDGSIGGATVNASGPQSLASGAAVKLVLGAGDNSVAAGSMYGGSITALGGGDTLAFNGDLGLLGNTAVGSEGVKTGFTTAANLVTGSNVTVNLGDGNNSLTAANIYGGTYTGTNGNDKIIAGTGDGVDATGDIGAITMTSATNSLVKLATGTAVTLNLGAGNNSVDADNMYGGKITGLAGNDVLAFNGDLGAMDNSDTNTAGASEDVSDRTDARKLAAGTAVTVNLGDGNNSLTAANMYGGTYTGTNGADVLAFNKGDGGDNDGDIGALGATGGTSAAKDLLKLAASTAVTLSLGNGANSVAAGSMYGGRITAGTGNDTLTFLGDIGALDGAETDSDDSASTAADARKLASGTAVTVNLGDGNNSLKAANMYGGTYAGTNGNDILVFTGTSGGGNNGDIGALGTAGGKLVLAANTGVAITLGNGVNSVAAGNMYGGRITGGTGIDTLTFLGDIGALDGTQGDASAAVVASARTTITLGDGANSLTAENVYGAAITGGRGNDTLTIGTADGSGLFRQGSINLGEGKNTLTIGDATNLDGLVYNSTISGGNGGNDIVINGQGGQGAYAMQEKAGITTGSGVDNVSITGNVASVNIKLGAGNDSLTLTDSEISGTSSGGYNTLMDLGAGDDRLALAGGTAFGEDDIFSSIKGGAGIDTLDLSGLDDATITLADLNQQNNTATRATYSLNGFDRIDLTGGTQTLELTATDVKNLGVDASLNFTYTVKAGEDNAGREITLTNTKTLIVSGDAADTVSLGAGLADNDNFLGTTRHNGVSYNVYQNSNATTGMGGANNYLMVQSDMLS